MQCYSQQQWRVRGTGAMAALRKRTQYTHAPRTPRSIQNKGKNFTHHEILPQRAPLCRDDRVKRHLLDDTAIMCGFAKKIPWCSIFCLGTHGCISFSFLILGFFCKIQDWLWKFPNKGILASEHDVWPVKIKQKLYIKHLRKYRVCHGKSANGKWNGLFQKWELNCLIR